MNFFILCFTAVFVHAVFCAPAKAPKPTAGGKLDYRLPTNVKPVNYVVELTPYFTKEENKEQFTFDGSVEITLSTNENDVKTIILHAYDDIQITGEPKLREFTYLWPTDKEIKLTKPEYNNVTQKLELGLETALKAGEKYVLSMNYVGKLGTEMRGFYRSSYEQNGEIKWLATTQLQPTHARRVFPCFDEPQFKATFEIRVNRPAHFKQTISNTELNRIEASFRPNFQRDVFEKTPAMSTYLVAIIVSEFSFRANEQANFRVYSRPEATEQTAYSLKMGPKFLEAFDNLFQYDRSLIPGITNLSLVALPDFLDGAMENWGLITFRESRLLYNAKVTTAMDQQKIATAVAHEIAHQFFGDLVTYDWWKHTWLSEGFATYFEYLGTDIVEPTWDLEQQFVVEQLQVGLASDSSRNTHPLSYDVQSPTEIKAIFDDISYNKGGAVIRMIEHWIGKEKFYAGLQQYLKENAFGTAVPEKLYSALQSQTKYVNVAEVMNSWVTQSGYPVITATIQDDGKEIEIEQKRFLLQNSQHTDTTQWWVPITYATAEEDENSIKQPKKVLLSPKQKGSLKITLKNPIDWALLNLQQTGFYRVNYDSKTWVNIAKALKKDHTVIPVENRAQLIDDALNLARGELLDYKNAFEILQYLKDETHYIPWLAAFNNLEFILNRFEAKEASVLTDHISGLLENVYNKLGFQANKDDTRLDIYNRKNVLDYLCRFGHKQCITDAQNEFVKLQTAINKKTTSVNVTPVIYCTAVSEGSTEEWQFLWNKFKKSNVAAEKVMILDALGCTKDQTLIKKYFRFIIKADVRLQDKHNAFLSTLRHQQNIETVLTFVFMYHKQITEAFSSNTEVPAMLSELVERLSDKGLIVLTKEFVKENENNYNLSEVLSALANTEHNLKWAESHIFEIKNAIALVTHPGDNDDDKSGDGNDKPPGNGEDTPPTNDKPDDGDGTSDNSDSAAETVSSKSSICMIILAFVLYIST